MDNIWIEIARTGTFTDSMGRQQTFTQADLANIAQQYDPAKRDAPLVFGHPKSDAAPAFGWVRKLKTEGEKLFASFAYIPDSVRKLVQQGHYRHVSMSLMPDRVGLRHVALLGAAQPAIDGLQAVEFSKNDADITIDFVAQQQGDSGMTIEELQRQIGQLQAQLDVLKTENERLRKQAEEEKKEKEKAEAEKANAESLAEQASADFAAYRNKIEGERREARVAALVQAGKIKPAEKANVLDFALKLAERGESVDFAAQDGTKKRMSLEDRYFCDLEARPVDERFANFSTPLPTHSVAAMPAYNAAEMASKL